MMQGHVWCYDGNQWRWIWLENIGDRLKAFAIDKSSKKTKLLKELPEPMVNGTLKLGLSTTVEIQKCDEAPSKFGFSIVHQNEKVLFCVRTEDELSSWVESTIRGIHPRSSVDSIDTSFSPIESRNTEPVTVDSSNIRNGNFVRLQLLDSQFEIPLGDNAFADNHTVLDLILELCEFLTSELDLDIVLNPSHIDLLLGNTRLREYWTTSQCGLFSGCELKLLVHNEDSAELNPGKMITRINLDNNGNSILLQIQRNEDPEEALTQLMEAFEIPPSEKTNLLCQVYKHLAELYYDERNHYFTKMKEVENALKNYHSKIGTNTKLHYKNLLQSTHEKVVALTQERASLKDELFNLRLSKAEQEACKTYSY